MKRVLFNLVVSLSVSSLALASNLDESLMGSGSRKTIAQNLSETQKLESQLHRWEIALKSATTSGGKKSKRAAKIRHCSEMVTTLQTELTQLKKLENKKARTNRLLQVALAQEGEGQHGIASCNNNLPDEKQYLENFLSEPSGTTIALPSQQEYIKAQSDAYMQEFLPFVSKYCKNNTIQAIIPDTLIPRTVIQIPHVNGALELELKGSVTSCRKHLQSFVLEFIEDLAKVESAKNTKGVLEKVYFEKDINQMRQNLATWINEAIVAHNKEAHDNQELRDQLQPQGVQIQRGGGMFTMSTNEFLSPDALMSMLMLSQVPVIEHLTDDDQERIQQMIQTARIIFLNPDKDIILFVNNFQGVQK